MTTAADQGKLDLAMKPFRCALLGLLVGLAFGCGDPELPVVPPRLVLRPAPPPVASVAPPAGPVVVARASALVDPANDCVREEITLASDGSVERAFTIAFPELLGRSKDKPHVDGRWVTVHDEQRSDGSLTIALCAGGIATPVVQTEGETDFRVEAGVPIIDGRGIVYAATNVRAGPARAVDAPPSLVQVRLFKDGKLALERADKSASWLRRTTDGSVVLQRDMPEAFGSGCGWTPATEIGDDLVLIYATSDKDAEVSVRRLPDGAELATKKLPFQPCNTSVAADRTGAHLAFGSSSLLYELDLAKGTFKKLFASSGDVLTTEPELRYADDGRGICLGDKEYPSASGRDACLRGARVPVPAPKGMSAPEALSYKYSSELPAVTLSDDGKTVYRMLYRTASAKGDSADYVLERLDLSKPGAPTSTLVDFGTRAWFGYGMSLDVDPKHDRFDVVWGDLLSPTTFSFNLTTGAPLETINGKRETTPREEQLLGLDLHAATTPEQRSFGHHEVRVSAHACIGIQATGDGAKEIVLPSGNKRVARLVPVGQGFVVVVSLSDPEAIDALGEGVDLHCEGSGNCETGATQRLKQFVTQCEADPASP